MFFNVTKTIKYNFKNFLILELFFKFGSFLFFTPCFIYLFNLIMKVSGYSYLTLENIRSFLLNPFTIFLILLLLMILTFYALFDIASIIILIDASKQKKELVFKDVFLTSLRKCFNIFKLPNMTMIFLVLFLIPFLNFGVAPSYISSLSVPEFIMDYISSNNWLSFSFFLFTILLIIIFSRWLYVLHYYVLEDCSFNEARKRSKILGRGHYFKDLLKIIVTQILIFFIYIIFVVLGIFLIFILEKFLRKLGIVTTFVISVIWLFIAFSFIVVTLMATPVSYICVSSLFYKHKKERNEKILHVKVNGRSIEKRSKRWLVLKYIFIFLVIVGATFFTQGVINGDFNLNIEYVKEMKVTAHRGASALRPENTMSSFVLAKELGSDWIELDVQQTKDGKIIVIHDHNFKRVGNLDKNTWEVTYDEIKDLDIGSYFDKEYRDERILLLEDVVKWAKKNRIKLNIELKPKGHEKNFENAVVDIIIKEDFLDECVLTSQFYDVLENVKKINDKVETVYVMSLAYGDITKLDKADHFSIEATSVTKSLVKRVHDEGKELYVWTVNTESSINKMINLNVDNIITDDIVLAKNLIRVSRTSDVITEYIKFVDNLFS